MLGEPMALVLTTATGRIDPERIEAFQVTFQTLMSRRFAEVPFLRQAVLVHLGDSVWQMLTLWDSTLAQTSEVDNDVPLTVRIFREFGTDPEIRLADVSAFLQAPVGRPTVAVEKPALKTEERPTGSREGSEDAGSVGE
jgi:hypothetical protein